MVVPLVVVVQPVVVAPRVNRNAFQQRGYQVPGPAMVCILPPSMAEKTEKQAPSLAEYRDLLAVMREKFSWARDYL
jgi:hypothetical protein